MRKNTDWMTLLEAAFEANGETWDDVEANTMSEDEMLRSFDPGYGGCEGLPFTVWTSKSVYFPASYDGLEWVARVARHPDGKPTPHVGKGG